MDNFCITPTSKNVRFLEGNEPLGVCLNSVLTSWFFWGRKQSRVELSFKKASYRQQSSDSRPTRMLEN